MEIDNAYKEIEHRSSTQFNPEVVNAFLEAKDYFISLMNINIGVEIEVIE